MKLNSSNYKLFFASNPNVNLSTLGYEGLLLLKAHISDITAFGSSLHKEHSRKKQSEYEQNRLKREEKVKDFEKNIFPSIREWAISNLRKGMRVRFKGTRDGKGIREIYSDYTGKGNVICVQIRQRREWDRNPNSVLKFTKVVESVGEMTQHGLDKLTHVWVDGEFVKIKDLIK